MTNILAIAQKELKSYFASPIAYIVIGFWALLYGYFFVAILSFSVRQSMHMNQFGMQGPQSMNVNQQLIRPLLQNVNILVLFLMPMVTMRTYSEEKRSGTIELLLTSPVTDFQIIMGKFLGAMALYCCMLAVTLNHIVAGMVTFAVFLLLWIITWIGSFSGPTVDKVTQYLSILDHLDDFGKGVLDTTHIIYYVSFITFGLFLTAKSVDSERWRG